MQEDRDVGTAGAPEARRGEEIPWQVMSRVEGLPLLGGAGEARLLLRGEASLTLQVRYPKGVSSPPHAHRHESHVYVLSGRVRGTLQGETVELEVGDAVLHPAGVIHTVEALEDASWIEVKTPPEVVWS